MRISQFTNPITPLSKRTKLKRMGWDVFGKVLSLKYTNIHFNFMYF